MTRPLMLLLAIAAVLSLAACSGSTAATATVAPTSPAVSASAPAASAPAASAPAASAPAASAPAAAGACAISTEAGTVQAGMAGRSFTPALIQAKVGDVIVWTNNDSVPHTATVRADPTCTTDALASGASGAMTFDAAGTYEFFCKIHADMIGTIEITE